MEETVINLACDSSYYNQVHVPHNSTHLGHVGIQLHSDAARVPGGASSWTPRPASSTQRIGKAMRMVLLYKVVVFNRVDTAVLYAVV